MPPPPAAGEKVVLSGWLAKKAHANAFSSGKQWNRRFFVLTSPAPGLHSATLRYYAGDANLHGAAPRGEASVRTNSHVRVLDTDASLDDHGLDRRAFAGRRVFVFQPNPGESKSAFVLEAESPATMHAWVAALSEAITEVRQAAPEAPAPASSRATPAPPRTIRTTRTTRGGSRRTSAGSWARSSAPASWAPSAAPPSAPSPAPSGRRPRSST